MCVSLLSLVRVTEKPGLSHGLVFVSSGRDFFTLVFPRCVRSALPLISRSEIRMMTSYGDENMM